MAIQSVLSEHVVQHTVTSGEATAHTCDIGVGPIAHTAKAIIAVKRATGGTTEIGGTITESAGVVTVADVATLFDLVENDVITLLFVE